jgi:NAD(P)-dependent dehydrogenase (short-subunit alcohol dehydrogenase family)
MTEAVERAVEYAPDYFSKIAALMPVGAHVSSDAVAMEPQVARTNPLLVSDEAKYVTGVELPIDARLAAF